MVTNATARERDAAAEVERLRRAWVEAEPGDASGRAWERFSEEHEAAHGYAPGFFEGRYDPGEAARMLREGARDMLRPPFPDIGQEAARAEAEGYERRAEACDRRAALLRERQQLEEVGQENDMLMDFARRFM